MLVSSQLPVILQRICPPQTLVLMCTHTLYTIHIIKIRNTSFIKKTPKTCTSSPLEKLLLFKELKALEKTEFNRDVIQKDKGRKPEGLLGLWEEKGSSTDTDRTVDMV